jgi:hypothetical protein
MLLPGQTDLTVTEWELLEVSMVSVPGNQNAVKLSARELGLPTLTKQKVSPSMDAKKIAQALGLDENADEAAVLAAATRLSADITKLNAARVDALIESGKASGVITAENEGAIRKLAAADYESTAAMIKSVPGKTADPVTPPPATGNEKTLVGMLSGGNVAAAPGAASGATDKREDWDFDRWSKEDPNGLLKLRTDDPKRYQTLAAAKYAKA